MSGAIGTDPLTQWKFHTHPLRNCAFVPILRAGFLRNLPRRGDSAPRLRAARPPQSLTLTNDF